MATPERSRRPLREHLWRFFTSLRSAVFLTVIVGVTVPAAISLYTESERLREDHFLALDDALGRTTTLLSMSMREPLWQLAPEQAHSVIEAAMATDPKIISIVIRDYQSREFSRGDRTVTDDEPTIVHTRPVSRDGKPIGIVIVEMTSSGYEEKLNTVLREYFLRGLMALIGTLAFIALILHFRLIFPINRLVLDSERLAAGQLDLAVQGGGQNELGRLANSLESTRLALSSLIRSLEDKNQQLQQSNDLLESRVEERTLDLANALKQLQNAQHNIIESEKLASLGRVVAGVAHELNTPIGNALVVATSIHEQLRPVQQQLLAGTVRKSTLTESLSRAEEGFTILLRSLNKAGQLIGDFKQVAVDQTSEQRRAFDLAEVTQEVLTTLLPTFRKTPYQLKSELTEEIACESYPGPYGQILTNLVLNALNHAFENKSEGEVTVRVDSPTPDIARLTVIDNGIGMSDEVKSQIFEPFFTTRLGRGGTGLGMNIAHSFAVQVLKGSLRFDSAPGQGTQFIVEFPCRIPETPTKK